MQIRKDWVIILGEILAEMGTVGVHIDSTFVRPRHFGDTLPDKLLASMLEYEISVRIADADDDKTACRMRVNLLADTPEDFLKEVHYYVSQEGFFDELNETFIERVNERAE